MFLTPGSEVLVARDGDDVVEHRAALTAPSGRRRSAQAARRRILAEHTYDRRAATLHALLQALARRREALAA